MRCIEDTDYSTISALRFRMYALAIAGIAFMSLSYPAYSKMPFYWWLIVPIILLGLGSTWLTVLILHSYPAWEHQVRDGLDSASIFIVCPDFHPLKYLADLVSESFSRHDVTCCLQHQPTKYVTSGVDPCGSDLDFAKIRQLQPSYSHLLLILKASHTAITKGEERLWSIEFDLCLPDRRSVLKSWPPKDHRFPFLRRPNIHDADAIVEYLIGDTKTIVRVEPA